MESLTRASGAADELEAELIAVGLGRDIFLLVKAFWPIILILVVALIAASWVSS